MTAPDWRREGRGWPLAEHSRFVADGPLVWHVQRLGSGPVLLLIHGTGAATHSWRGLAPLLADRFTVVAVDLPGHGFTRGRLPTGLALPGIARALGALCAAEGIAPAALIGHSAGAAIAVRMVMDGAVPAAAPSPPVHVIGLCPALRPFGGDAAGLMSGMARLMFANPAMPWLAAGLARFAVRTDSFLARSTGSRIDAEGQRFTGGCSHRPGTAPGRSG
ncbi:alpha/beta fold hydrolase [Sphingomonas changnyeongensis]|uniref:alpha/beta fold hydrolase n=1 Tax=Sphingomonas changnyeongensis TaxID=2698679 RepID=UPI001E2D3B0D|nr:alpha/beta fold hydrolase [Sphingomonas changnyeongensis]